MAVFEIVLEGRQLGQDMLTVLHYDFGGGGDPDWQNVADLIRSDMVDNLRTLLTPQTLYEGITVREDTPGAVGVTYFFGSGDLVGTGAGSDNLNQAAALVRKLTNSTVRPTQGRVYQGGMSVGATEADGRWATIVRTNLAAFWTDMILLIPADSPNGQMVIKSSKPTKPNTQPYTPVSSVQVEPVPVTQRRRRLGIGS